MIERLMAFSIRNKLIVALGTLILILTGIFSLTRLPIDAVPDITDNQVQVITPAPELSAQEVEKLITYPLEMTMGYIPGVETIRSISRFGLSVITIVFREDIDIYWAREQIYQKIASARSEIPDQVGSPQLGPLTSGLGEIYQYVVFPAEGYEDTYDNYDLRTIQDWIIKRQLTGIPGVVEVNSSGGYLKQYEITVSQDKLKAYNISLADLFEAVEKNNQNAGGSYIESANYTYFIRGEGMVTNNEDLENIVLRVDAGTPILLSQVARVTIGKAPRFGAVTMNGRGEVVAGQVMMLIGENSMLVVRRVKERIEEIRASLPEGIMIEPYLDRSKLVNKTTWTVSKNLIEGALIVIFILVLFLGDLRAGFIVASVIPLSMLFAVTMMRIFGVSANLMSLGALDFGLIVDGAVIIVEAVLHHLGVKNAQAKLSRADQELEIESAAKSIRKSAAFGEIIILIVYLPILFLTGVEGKMFIPMAQTVSFAILGALILSMTYVPMMSAQFLINTKESKTSFSARIIDWVYAIYRPILELSMRFKYLILLIAAILFTLSIIKLSRMGGEFIPTLEEGDFALHQILPTGSSLEKGIQVSAKLQNILMQNFPEVEKVVTKIGTAEIPTDIMPLEAGDIYVILKPKAEWTSARTREEMFAAMEAELEKYPGVIYEFTQPIQMRFNELMTGVRQDIAIMIYGEELGTLSQLAKSAETMLGQVPGVGDIKVESTTGLQQMVIRYDRLKLAKYGLNITDVNTVVQTAFAGKVAGNFYEGERRFDIVVRLAESERQSLENLRQLMISLPGEGYVPLAELASVEFEEGPAQISRHNTKRRITVGVNTRDMDIATVVASIKEKLTQELNLPSGYYIRYGGQFENLERAKSTLSVVVPLALGLIFILLYFTFGSIILALLIFTAIPLSAVGGIWALYFRDMPFSISAGVGFVALFGVAVLNGIVLISSFNDLKKSGYGNVNEIIRDGTRLRLRPVMLTALVASLGFLPMALSTTAGAEVQRPLATVVIGGLLTATALTLFILPILYSMLHKYTNKKIKTTTTLLAALILCIPGGIFSQSSSTTDMDTYLQSVWSSNDLKNAQENRRAALVQRGKVPFAPGPLSITARGEEFNFSGISGIYSLDLGKSFYLPQRQKAYYQWADIQAELSDASFVLDRKNINASLIAEFVEAAFLQSQAALTDEMIQKLMDFQAILDKRAQRGESGTLPAEMITNDIRSYGISLKSHMSRLSALTGALKSYAGLDELNFPDLYVPVSGVEQTAVVNHPQMQFNEKQKLIAEGEYNTLAADNLPFIRSGISLQSVNNDLLYFGFQLGVNIPLSRSFLASQKTALNLNTLSIDDNARWLQKTLDIRRDKLLKEISTIDTSIEELETDQLPGIQKVITRVEEAFRFGEASLADIRKTYESYFEARQSRLVLLKERMTKYYQLKYYIY